MPQRQKEAAVPKRLYDFPDLAPAGVPFCMKHLRTLESLGKFPLRVQLTEHRIAWVADKIAARRVVPLSPRLPGRPPKVIGPPIRDEPAPRAKAGAVEQPPPLVRRGPGRPRKIAPVELAPAE